MPFPNWRHVKGHSTIMDDAYGRYYDAVRLAVIPGKQAKQPSVKPKPTLRSCVYSTRPTKRKKYQSLSYCANE